MKTRSPANHARRREAFLARLDEALRRAGLTRAALAKRLGIGAGAVSEWFTQGYLPAGDKLLQLPEILNANGHWLLTGQGSPEARPAGNSKAVARGARLAIGEIEAAIGVANAALRSGLHRVRDRWTA